MVTSPRTGNMQKKNKHKSLQYPLSKTSSCNSFLRGAGQCGSLMRSAVRRGSETGARLMQWRCGEARSAESVAVRMQSCLGTALLLHLVCVQLLSYCLAFICEPKLHARRNFSQESSRRYQGAPVDMLATLWRTLHMCWRPLVMSDIRLGTLERPLGMRGIRTGA